MRNSTPLYRRLLDAAQRRFARSRPGSVLILVVALLVLLALIGTAYMTMAQGDRAAAQQHTFNTEVDLLLEGVENMVKGTVVGELFVNGQFRPANGYNSWNSLGLDSQTINSPQRKWGPNGTTAGTQPGNPWLASRVPEPLDPRTVNNIGQIVPAWRYITAPLNGGVQFDSPYWRTIANTPVPMVDTLRDSLLPTHTADPRLRALFPNGTVDGQDWPAFIPTLNQNGNVALDVADAFMAADADGDGIADSAYVKLLTLDGITYYAAVRIVDNLAAVNASVAIGSTSTFPNINSNTLPFHPPGSAPGTYNLFGDFSPTSISLQGMIWPQQDSSGFLQSVRYRFGGNFNLIPFNDNGQRRNDFVFSTLQEAAWDMLGRRLANPVAPYTALPLGETMAMTHDFCLAPATPTSLLEQWLPGATSGSTSPYLPSQVPAWFTSNFDYGSTSRLMPSRAILLSRNPVTTFTPSKFAFVSHQVGNNPSAWQGGRTYNFGDVVLGSIHNPNDTMNPKSSYLRPFVCINGSQGGLIPPTVPFPNFIQPSPPENAAWVSEPWTDAPTKTSVNTGSFGQLWLAYWNVVTEANGLPMFPVGSFNATTLAGGAGKMFRSPIRTNTASGGGRAPGGQPILFPQQVAQLRAALAAINTVDLRSSVEDVTSRTITLSAPGAPTVFQAQIFGIKKQPYITEVYAQNSPTPSGGTPADAAKNDWVAVELYNPYPNVGIQLTNWHLAALDRMATTGMTLTDLGTIPASAIQGQQFLVLTNSLTPPKNVTTLDTKGFVVIDKLADALGKELVLLRPRRADGKLTKSTDPSNQYDETLATAKNVNDLVPVDSYDFTNLAPGTDAMKKQNSQAWHYIRPNDPKAGKAWHWVYPGRWQPLVKAPAGGPPPSGNTAVPTVEPTKTIDLTTNAPPEPLDQTLGKADANTVDDKNVKAVYKDIALQLDNTDFAGPNKVPQSRTNQPNYFPFGQFARNGDILQVTFISSYKLYTLVTDKNKKTAAQLVEVNPVTMDSAMAVASDPTDAQAMEPYLSSGGAAAENIGRFCPIDSQDKIAGVDDFAPPPLATQTPGQSQVSTQWRYHWATKLFDYLTAESPQDDYLPDVDPGIRDYLPAQPPAAGVPDYKYYPALMGGTNVPWPVPNKVGTIINNELTNPNGATEETSAIEGLINVNTAPWRVLAAVPFMPPTSSGAPQIPPGMIAQSIVYYRDVNDGKNRRPHGPFGSLFELNDVPIYTTPAQLGTAPTRYFRDLLGSVDNSSFGPAYGDYSPVTPNTTTSKPAGDFQARFLMLNRVSNLLTTRSDSFTAYILVQGWRNAETPTPHLVVQRRTTLLLDRSPVTPVNKSADVTHVPSD